MNNQESCLLADSEGDLSFSTNSTESTDTKAVGMITSAPGFHRSQFLIIKKTVENVLCWFKSLVVLKHVKQELYFAVELANQLNSLLELDKRGGIALPVLKHAIAKLNDGLVKVKASAMRNVRVAMEEKRDTQREEWRSKERMAAMREKMERTARWVAEVAVSGA